MKLLGVLLILNAIAISIWQLASPAASKWVIPICLVAVFAGLALILQDRITELTVKGVGSIKAASQQAETKLQEINDIKKRVEAQSATIDIVAKEASDAKALTTEVEKKSQKIEDQIKDFDTALAKANAQAKELSVLLEFTNSVVAAKNEDRAAFDKLEAWSKDPSFPYQKEAQQAWISVLDDHSQPFMSSGFTIPWKEGFDPSKLDLDGLAQQFSAAPEPLKIGILEYIWNRADIPKVQRMDFLLEVLKASSNLKTAEYAGRYFTQGADLKIKPLAVEYLANWWKENRDKIKQVEQGAAANPNYPRH